MRRKLPFLWEFWDNALLLSKRFTSETSSAILLKTTSVVYYIIYSKTASEISSETLHIFINVSLPTQLPKQCFFNYPVILSTINFVIPAKILPETTSTTANLFRIQLNNSFGSSYISSFFFFLFFRYCFWKTAIFFLNYFMNFICNTFAHPFRSSFGISWISKKATKFPMKLLNKFTNY